MTTVDAGMRRWLVIAIVLLIGGCATSPEQRAKSAPGALQVAPGQGVLAVKITTNRRMVSTFFFKWTTLRVRNLESKESFTLTDRADSSASHSLFVDPLPAGTYALDAVGNMASGWMTITEGAKAQDLFPTFRIADGQLTHLGTLAYIRRHYPVNSALFRWGQGDSPLDVPAVMRQLEPSLAVRLGARAVLGWDEGDLLKVRRDTLGASRQATMRMFATLPLSDGRLLFGESFGQIVIRSRDGALRWIQTPTVLPIYSLYLGENGALIAGSDDGVLLSGSIDGGTWRAIPPPVNDGSVIYIGPGPEGPDLLIVLQTRDRFVGFSTSSAVPGQQWSERFSRPRELFSNPAFDANGRIVRAGDKFFLATGGPETQREVTWYDRSDRSWKVKQLPDKGRVDAWLPMRDGSVVGFSGIPLTGMYFSSSVDYGATWERRGDLNWANGALMFLSEQVGFVVRTDSIPAVNPEKIELSLWRTDDGGRTWSNVGPLPALHGAFVPLGSAKDMGYRSENGRFLVSTDGGKTWRVEREIP